MYITAKTLNVNVEKGSITVNHATISGDSRIVTQDGDVIFQSSSDFSVSWENQNSYYCLGAPNGASIAPLKTPSGCWLDPKDTATAKEVGSQVSTNCTAAYSLCASSGCSATPTVTLSAGKGSIYANLVPKGTYSLPQTASILSSAPF